MTTSESELTPAATQTISTHATTRARRPKVSFKGNWWRHLVACIAIVVALFPVVFIVSSAFNRDNTLSGAQVIPTHVTLHNFGNLLHNNVSTSGGGKADAPYLSWVVNSMIIAGATALFSTMLGALAAYAFSRFRFKGRRMGMVALLLIQMFPQTVAVAAIYLLMLNVGKIFHPISLNTLLAVIVVYLGGAMGVQTWLLKGFLDTIPRELDESARVDGATPAQIFWGVVLPLAAPVLTVVGLFSFIATINEYLIASVLLQTKDNWTLPLGLRGFIDQQYGQHWGPFAAGVLLAAIPAIILWQFLQRYVVAGLTQGSVKG
jgi:arabinogalactan oligomer/maltooligosaccharide transport system permease protein